LLATAVALYARAQFGHLAYPLLWQDEGETAMYAQQIRDYGYPRVHGSRNVVYEFGTNVAQGVKEGIDAYIGTPWGHFYCALPGLLWAEGSADPYVRTWRLRLPFALAGAAGLGLLLWAVLPVERGRPGRALAFAALYFLLCATSISLQLHLRELRYYPLLALLVAAIGRLHLQRVVFGALSPARYALAVTPLLVLLWNVFHPAWAAAVALLGLECGIRAFRARGPGRRAALRDLVPLALSAALLAPLFAFFETFAIAGELARELGLSPRLYAENLGRTLVHFLRHELLGPLLVTRIAVLAVDRGGSGDARAPSRRVADRLSLFALGYALIVALNPLAYERYTVVLSPLLSLAFLLDAFRLAECLPARLAPPRRRAARAAVAAAAAALVLASLGVRLPELRGRLAELRVPYQGPVDFAVLHLRARHARTEDLVVATNYENHPLMYYLGSRVIVGGSLSNIVRDRELVPDVVIPRRRWSRGLDELGRLLEGGVFERHGLRVADLHWNNIPALSRSPLVPDPHRFRTASTGDASRQLVIHERIR